MSSVLFDAVTCVYPGAERPSVDDLTLSIDDGEFLVLVGPSGCGKSTILRMLAGLEQVTSGTIRIGDRDVTDVEPKDRDIAMVFQNYALYPHMSVAENMGFALKLAGVNRADREQKVRETARLLDLEAVLDRKPKALSGGQRQRVAMGRAIVREPKVFLMDEPLSNLDARLRVQTRGEIARLTRELGITTVYVTHDQTEAMTMGHRVAVLKDGVLQQLSAPTTLYDRPNNAFVAGFIGSPSMSLFTVPVADGRPMLNGRALSGPVEAAGGLVQAGIRPEDVHLAAPDEADTELTVDAVEVLGAEAFVYGRTHVHGADSARLTARVSGRRHPGIGETVPVRLDTEQLHLFDAATGRRLEATVSA